MEISVKDKKIHGNTKYFNEEEKKRSIFVNKKIFKHKGMDLPK